MSAARPGAGGRGRVVLILLLLGVAGFGLSALPWLELSVPTVLDQQQVTVSGATAVPTIGAASLAVLAAALAVAIGGLWVRRLGGLALVAVGVLVVGSTVRLLVDPEPAARAAAAALSGVPEVAGPVSVNVWPYATALLGLLIVAGGIRVLATRTWSGPARRYERGPVTPPSAARAEPAGGTPDSTSATPRVQAMDDWDALGRGEDPTDAEHR